MKRWLEKYSNGGNLQEYQPNFNESHVSIPPNFVGQGHLTTGRNWSPAWGGQFEDGGEIAQNGTTRPTFEDWHKTIVPSREGKARNDTTNYKLRRAYELAPQKELDEFATNPDAHLNTFYFNDQGVGEFMKSKNHPTIKKETEDFFLNDMSRKAVKFRKHYDLDKTGEYYKYLPKKQNGGTMPGSVGFSYARTGPTPSEGKYAKKTMPSAENGMSFYQNGLDWKPNNISQNGSIIKDDDGYWNPDNWGHPVEIGSNDITMQGVNQDLIGVSDTGDTKLMHPGEHHKFKGKKVREYPVAKNGKELTRLDQLTNFTNYNKPQPGGWLEKYSS